MSKTNTGFRSNIGNFCSDPFLGTTDDNPNKRISNSPLHKQISKSYGKKHSAAFPENYTYCGFLDVRTSSNKSWKRRYFVLSNNFLLCAATPHAEKLERVTPLEGGVFELTSNRKFYIMFKNSKKKIFFKAPNPDAASEWSGHIAKALKLKIKDIYRFLYTLGTSESQNTKVVAAKHRDNGQDCAIKIVDKRLCDQKLLRQEIQILKRLDNKYIVKLHDLFETKKFLYIVMEKCEGGELFDQIADLDGDHYTEKDCCEVMHQIAKGVQYMHQMNIVHRDLKPENILCVYKNSIKDIKIADFGISKILKHDNKMMKTQVGTLTYTAPEVLYGRGYTRAVDYWSIGCIMYILLCGYPPFYGDTEEELQNEILKSEVEFIDEDWEHVSKDTMELVKGLLHKNPKKRLTCDNIKRQVWKVSSKSMAFTKAHTKFQQHVIESKRLRISMGVFEKNSNYMNQLYKKNPKTSTKHAKPNTKSRSSLKKIKVKHQSKDKKMPLELRMPNSPYYNQSRDSVKLYRDTNNLKP